MSHPGAGDPASIVTGLSEPGTTQRAVRSSAPVEPARGDDPPCRRAGGAEASLRPPLRGCSCGCGQSCYSSAGHALWLPCVLLRAALSFSSGHVLLSSAARTPGAAPCFIGMLRSQEVARPGLTSVGSVHGLHWAQLIRRLGRPLLGATHRSLLPSRWVTRAAPAGTLPGQRLLTRSATIVPTSAASGC